MRALLLAAGLGMRLRPLTLTTPKCLIPIHGKPLLDYWFEHLFAAGIERALVNTHWLADRVRAHVEQSRYRDRIDLVHEPELLGTGGMILANRQWLDDETFLVCHADNLTDFDVSAFQEAHRARAPGCLMTMLSFRTDAPETCGILEIDRRGVVTGFHEKVENPPGNLANAAVYLFEPDVVEMIAALNTRAADLSTQILPDLVGRIQSFETRGYHRDIGTVEALRLAESEFSGHRS